jgi:hypothetical protein
VGGELLNDAAANFEFNRSTPSACGRSTSCNSDADVIVFVLVDVCALVLVVVAVFVGAMMVVGGRDEL